MRISENLFRRPRPYNRLQPSNLMTTIQLSTLSSYLRWRSLLIVWAEMPWPPGATAPANRALVINRWRDEAAALPALAWPLPSLPPVSILSLDPSPRLAQAFRAAGVPLHRVAGRSDVPVAGQHNLLQLGGDLERRQGLLLAWADVAGLKAQPDKHYLLAEAARLCRHGGVLALNPGGGYAFPRLWQQTLAPALGATAAETDVYGLGSGPWPPGIEPLIEPAAAVFEALSQVQMPRALESSRAGETLKEQRHQHVRRLLRLQEELAFQPGQIGLQLQIEDEQQRIAVLERQLDELLGIGD